MTTTTYETCPTCTDTLTDTGECLACESDTANGLTVEAATIASVPASQTNTLTIDVPLSDLRRIVGNVLPMVMAKADRAGIPALGNVRFTFEGNTLTVAATDRYVIGTDTLTLPESGPSLAVSLNADALTAWLKATKSLKWQTIPVTVAAANAGGSPIVIRIGYTDSGDLFTVDTNDYPRVAGLLEGWRPSTGDVVSFGLDPAKVAKFAKVQPAEDIKPFTAAKFELGATATRPLRVTVGPTFVGLIMPVRMGD